MSDGSDRFNRSIWNPITLLGFIPGWLLKHWYKVCGVLIWNVFWIINLKSKTWMEQYIEFSIWLIKLFSWALFIHSQLFFMFWVIACWKFGHPHSAGTNNKILPRRNSIFINAEVLNWAFWWIFENLSEFTTNVSQAWTW